MTLPNGVKAADSYGAVSELTGLTYKLGTTTLGAYSYSYDGARRRLTQSVSFSNTTQPAAVASAFNRRQSATIGTTTTSYLYDGVNPVPILDRDCAGEERGGA